MTRLSTAPARLRPSLVTVAVMLFAAWTVAYEVALLSGPSAAPTLFVGMVVGAVVLVVLSRLDGDDGEHLVPLPGRGPHCSSWP